MEQQFDPDLGGVDPHWLQNPFPDLPLGVRDARYCRWTRAMIDSTVPTAPIAESVPAAITTPCTLIVRTTIQSPLTSTRLDERS